MRYRAKVDQSQKDIVDGLRAHGYSVQSIASVGRGAFDLVVGGEMPITVDKSYTFFSCNSRGAVPTISMNVLLEVKTPARLKAELRRKDRAMQRLRQAEWKGPKATVTCLDEALKVLRGEV